MSKTTIGENPLDAVIPTSQEVKKGPKPKGDINGKDPQKLPADKQRLTVQVSEEALERAINALEKNNAIFCDKTGDPLKKSVWRG